MSSCALGRDRDWVEWQRTVDILHAHLPAPSARVADVGGGPARHAVQLRERGYTVDLFDLVARHVAAAREAGVTASVTDARAVPLPDESVDAVLLLGPLYHLPAAADRGQALAEAYRILRPGGRVFAAALSRVGRVLVGLWRGLDTLADWMRALRVLDTGIIDDATCSTATRHSSCTGNCRPPASATSPCPGCRARWAPGRAGTRISMVSPRLRRSVSLIRAPRFT